MEDGDETVAAAGGAILNFRATELRLGLPGSDSPERDAPDPPEEAQGLLAIGLSNNSSGRRRRRLGMGPQARDFFPVSRDKYGDTDTGCGPTGKWVLPGPARPMKQVVEGEDSDGVAPASSRTQVVGWPPIRSFRKNTMASHPAKADNAKESKAGSGCLYVKVSMDGAPYLRKVHLATYGSYSELSSALENMFSCFILGQCSSHGVPSQDGLSASRLMDLLHGSEYVLTYEDKDGDWMLVGDVPWKMFTETCRRLRIMKSSEAIGLAPRTMEKQLQQ